MLGRVSAWYMTIASALLLAGTAQAAESPRATVDGIRSEAVRSSDDPVGYPLPLAAHWNTGSLPGGFSPAYQIRMIRQGHHLLPWFQMPSVPPIGDEEPSEYYEAAIKRAARLNLPISLVGTQWERILTEDKAYLELPPDANPNVVGPDGKVAEKVSPFGPTEPWREVGARWTASPMMRKLQEWYPDPPLVMFVSNNEHARLQWSEVETDKRYLDLYGKGRDDDFKRKVVAEGWIERYRALQEGMREALVNPNWRRNAVFVGYEAVGPAHFARWDGWKEYSLYVPGRIDPSPFMWDGGSPSYYTHNWNASTDYRVWSPQVEFMNLVFMQEEARKQNPKFRFEFSTWDGHEPSRDNDKRKFYAAQGQTFTPERYGGFVQFGMWLNRPRVVREFRGWTDTVENAGGFFDAILANVDRVYASPVLQAFWRQGRLVPNRVHDHPYQVDVPPEYAKVDRWFLLDTNLDPPRPWAMDTEIPVFALALVRGERPRRQWLVYAHAPLGERKMVEVTVPEYGVINVDVSVVGSFYVINERDGMLETVR